MSLSSTYQQTELMSMLKLLLEDLRPFGFMPSMYAIHSSRAYQQLLELDSEQRQFVIMLVLELLRTEPTITNTSYQSALDRDIYLVFLKRFLDNAHHFSINDIAPVFQQLTYYYGHTAWLYQSMLLQYYTSIKQHPHTLARHSQAYLHSLLEQPMLADSLDETIELRAQILALLGPDPLYLYTVLDATDPIIEQLKQWIAQQTDQALWYQLVGQWVQATPTTPTILWRLQTQQAFSRLGTERVQSAIERLLNMVAQTPYRSFHTASRLLAKNHYVVSPYNVAFVKGLLWSSLFVTSEVIFEATKRIIQRSIMLQPALVYAGVYALLQAPNGQGSPYLAELLKTSHDPKQKRTLLSIARVHGWQEHTF